MIGGVAKLAIEDVKIYDNTSALFDEMLAHRLGMIPLRTERSVHVPAAECTCEAWAAGLHGDLYPLRGKGRRWSPLGDLIPQDPSTDRWTTGSPREADPGPESGPGGKGRDGHRESSMPSGSQP